MIPTGVQVFLALEPVDMRYGYPFRGPAVQAGRQASASARGCAC